jgi:formylglycine-generating enzyme required for sulfatase activity
MTGGIHDLAGNVREWIRDGYDPNFYKASRGDNPMAPDSDGTSVVRGGSFASAPAALVVWARDHLDPTSPAADIGVRCARATD